MQNKDDNTVLRRIESIFQNPRYASSNKLSAEHIAELKKVILSNEAIAYVLSGLCDSFDKSQYDAIENAKCLVKLVRMHQVDPEKGNERMVYLANEVDLEETRQKFIN